MCVIVARQDAERTVEVLNACGEKAVVIGEVRAREDKEIVIC